ncbi:hypothetical protein Tco_0633512 [Tanacetum coccineum]
MGTAYQVFVRIIGSDWVRYTQYLYDLRAGGVRLPKRGRRWRGDDDGEEAAAVVVYGGGEGGEAVEVRVVVRRVVAWRWRVGGGNEGDATVGMVAAGGVVTAARCWRGWDVGGGHGDGDEDTDIQEKEQKESQNQTKSSTGRKGPSQVEV